MLIRRAWPTSEARPPPMKIKLIAVLGLMMIVALFSVQNAEVITVRFLHWRFTLSQALVILLSAFSGSLVGLIIGALGGRSSRPQSRSADSSTPAP